MSVCENWAVIFTYLFLGTCITAYKPVVIIHGVLSGNITMLPMAERIKQAHPGTKVYVTDKFAGFSSLTPMWHQIQEMGEDLMKISADHPEGINLIGYSQGGLIARGILEQFPNHVVDTFISLSSPQAGQYGTKFLHLFFPGMVCHTAYELFYSSIGQHTSIGNYWNDPHHQGLYRNYSRFLPYINNEVLSSQSNTYKYGITKLRKLILIGGPDDGVITPWQSSHFGYFDDNEEVVELRGRKAYVLDKFGLKTLDKRGRLTLIELSGVSHYDWHTNKTVIDKYIVPFLS
ncbi:lysosomal thioesterase PPT2 homolog [Zootermopsis nevadensis]|uniref:palmitoyl-CoA hydrolase n=1 Tax=Zootermopsis nevadensis TaxID=136037 RepID=A0A067RNM5_ZOONE|nr:lysosomal thioesterase PPT2 homolog [Zootermopsis nevadensis]KDR22190.1 Lysosomal thioesterase PPT2-like protein [Zootermopsis nevadensis]